VRKGARAAVALIGVGLEHAVGLLALAIVWATPKVVPTRADRQ
jgi:hypothetical protein